MISKTCNYHCVTRGCKVLEKVGPKLSYHRHEMKHYLRYPCHFCHSKTEKLLRNIGCQREESEKEPYWFHLEVHRLQIGQFGQKATKLFTRCEGLEEHLKKAHGHEVPLHNTALLASSTGIAIKKTTACDICNDAVLFNRIDLFIDHMWRYHWQEGYDVSLWSEDRVIWKLISQKPHISQAWRECSHLGEPFGIFTWHLSDFRKLQLELGVGRLSPVELVKMAIECAHFSPSDNISPQDIKPVQYASPSQDLNEYADHLTSDQSGSIAASHSSDFKYQGSASDCSKGNFYT